MTEESKSSTIKITPESALGYVDEVVAKYEGTRDDHRVLLASMNLLRQIVADHTKLVTSQQNSPAPKTNKNNGKGVKARRVSR
jgi:hypothetical protein